ncbi:MAG: bifunctional glutamate N-acetyltransferase/amino-acid acetyltransferase ArgJ [Caulobacteraceae bacterium]
MTSILKRAALNRAERDSRPPLISQPKPSAAAKARVSPLAAPFPDIPAVPGVEIATTRAGLHRRQRDDVMVMRFAEGTACAGVFTQHPAAAAPVDWCRRQLEAGQGQARALVVNAGCANAFTGKAGSDACRRLAAVTAKRLGVRQREVMLASTGRMGVVLDDAKVIARLPRLEAGFSPRKWREGACAMMSTDTFPKGAHATALIDGERVQIAGIAKGAGMIAPDMATALAFIVTDAAISEAALQTLAGLYIRSTFNSVTVDGDPSTNDTCLLFATGQTKAPLITRAGDKRLSDFRTRLEQVMLSLAFQVVRDGEGATKFVKVTVTGAETPASARRIARVIAESQGVKAALGAEVPAWGRIVAAAGAANELVRRERLSVAIGPVLVMHDGAVAAGYREDALREYLAREELEIAVDAGVGRSSAHMWTCDLTRRYIDAGQARRG